MLEVPRETYKPTSELLHLEKNYVRILKQVQFHKNKEFVMEKILLFIFAFLTLSLTNVYAGANRFNCSSLLIDVKNSSPSNFNQNSKRPFVCAAYNSTSSKFETPIAFLDSLNETPSFPNFSDIEGKKYTCCKRVIKKISFPGSARPNASIDH